MFTVTLLNEPARRKPHLWKCLGFLPIPDKEKNTNGRHLRHYHAALDTLLDSLVKYQTHPPVVRIRLGEEYRYCRARIWVVNFIADGLANEALTGRKQSRGESTRRLCCACLTPSEISSSVNHKCKFLTQYGMEKLTIAALGPEGTPTSPTGDSPFESAFLPTIEEKHRGMCRRLLRSRMKICTAILSTCKRLMEAGGG